MIAVSKISELEGSQENFSPGDFLIVLPRALVLEIAFHGAADGGAGGARGGGRRGGVGGGGAGGGGGGGGGGESQRKKNPHDSNRPDLFLFLLSMKRLGFLVRSCGHMRVPQPGIESKPQLRPRIL